MAIASLAMTHIRVLRSGRSGPPFLPEAGLAGGAILRELAAFPDTPLPQAILLTHEHDDHARGAASLARALGVPVFANEGTIRAGGALLAGAAGARLGTRRSLLAGRPAGGGRSRRPRRRC